MTKGIPQPKKEKIGDLSLQMINLINKIPAEPKAPPEFLFSKQ